jgi:peptidoglycan/LPS O-acetylase OafA/YrhL
MKTNTQIKTPGNDKNAAIETLRALAVALVFVHHLYSGANIVLLPFVAHIGGWLGVQIFFVVSGYLIIISAK